MRKPLTIARANLRILFRIRSNIFFVIILPMMLIFLIGSVFGGAFTPEVGVYDAAEDSRSEELVAALEANGEMEIVRFNSEDALVDAVSRGQVQAGIAIPAGFTATAEGGETASVSYFGRPDSLAPQLRATVNAAVARQNLLLRAALFARDEAGVPLEQGAQQAAEIEAQLPPVDVTVTTVGEDLEPEEGGGFEASASSQLLLFIYLTSLTGSVALIWTRRLGISRRMLSTPTSVTTILFGEALGRYGVALLQGLIIMDSSALFFGVSWGNPPAAVLVMLLFALTGAGAGMLLGSVLDSEQQASAVGLLVGLGSAAIGGSMVPLEIFPDTLRKIAHATPHAWGNDAFNILLREDGGIADIAVQLGMLAAFAATFLLLASFFLHRKLVRGG